MMELSPQQYVETILFNLPWRDQHMSKISEVLLYAKKMGVKLTSIHLIDLDEYLEEKEQELERLYYLRSLVAEDSSESSETKDSEDQSVRPSALSSFSSMPQE